MKTQTSILALLALLGILAVAAFLRLWNIDATPGWYNDEGTYINVAENLLAGKIEYFGVQGSMLFPGRMPLFLWLLALVFRVFGVDITVLRALTGSLGVIATLLVFLILRRRGLAVALLCALTFAIFPQAVAYARIGFSYNLLAVLVLALFWACDRYLATGEKRCAAAGAAALGLCLLSEVTALVYLPVFIIVILWKRWRDLLFALPLALAPYALYTIAMLLLYPNAYGPDLQYAMSRSSAGILPLQFVMILINAGSTHSDLWMFAGAAGLIISPVPGLQKRLILFAFLPLIIFTRSVAVLTLGWYYLIPLFPFYACGFGLLAWRLARESAQLGKNFFQQIVNRLPFTIPVRSASFILAGSTLALILLVLIAPATFSTVVTAGQIVGGTYETSLEPILVNPAETRQVVQYLNNHSDPEDVILASPSIAWALDANATDYHITLAYMGLSAKFFPIDISRSRFRFDPSYLNARYIVIDNVWRNWGEPNLKDLEIVRRFAEKNPVVIETDHITVFEIKNAH